jgi:hypothetical protein
MVTNPGLIELVLPVDEACMQMVCCTISILGRSRLLVSLASRFCGDRPNRKRQSHHIFTSLSPNTVALRNYASFHFVEMWDLNCALWSSFLFSLLRLFYPVEQSWRDKARHGGCNIVLTRSHCYFTWVICRVLGSAEA